MRPLVLGLCALSLPALAWADQCQALSEEVARKAIQVLADHQESVAFCAPCGDAAPSAPAEITAIGFRATSGYYEVSINDRPVDLAYVYVGGKNAASLVGCPTSGVPTELPGSKAPSK